jgi:FKBP-type peptidyl-prolyl cis-trans isomerase SlyD
MRVAKHVVVSLGYTLTGPDGEVLDTSEGGEPLAYLHGTGVLVPGLEAALDGREKGERFDVRVSAAEGYGERDEALVQIVERNKLPLELELGQQLLARGPEGERILTVIGIEGDAVVLDANHPLAGMELHFVGEVRDLRVATAEELAHGHVHGPHGHGH